MIKSNLFFSQIRFLLTQSQRKYIESLTSGKKVVVFMKGDKIQPKCGFSKGVIDILKLYEVSPQTYDILSDNDLREQLKEFSDWPTFPQVYINGKFQGGFDVMLDLHNQRKLQTLLEDAGVV